MIAWSGNLPWRDFYRQEEMSRIYTCCLQIRIPLRADAQVNATKGRFMKECPGPITGR